MTRDADPRIVREHALEPPAGGCRPVGDADLSRVQRVPDSDAAAVVERHPAGAGGGVQQCVEDRPVGDGVRAVLHRLRLAEWRGHGARIEVVTPDDDGRAYLTLLPEVA